MIGNEIVGVGINMLSFPQLRFIIFSLIMGVHIGTWLGLLKCCQNFNIVINHVRILPD